MPFAKIKFLSRRNSSHCFDKCFAYYWADWNLRPHGNIKIRNTKKVWWWRWMVNRMTFTFGVHLNNDRFALSLFIIAKIGSAITYRRLHRMQVAHAIMSNLPMINRGAQKLICGLGPGSFQISFLQFKEISLFWSFWNARSQSFNETWIEQQSKVAVTSCSTDHDLLLETLVFNFQSPTRSIKNPTLIWIDPDPWKIEEKAFELNSIRLHHDAVIF